MYVVCFNIIYAWSESILCVSDDGSCHGEDEVWCSSFVGVKVADELCVFGDGCVEQCSKESIRYVVNSFSKRSIPA